MVLYYGSLRLEFDMPRKTLSRVFFGYSLPGDPVYRYNGKVGVGSTQEEVFAELGRPLRTAHLGLAGTPPDRTLFVSRPPEPEWSTILYADYAERKQMPKFPGISFGSKEMPARISA